MTQEPATLAASPASERRFEGRMRPWEFVFLIAFASGILITYYWQSGKQYLSNDELVTAVVVNNSSFSEMLKAIRHGGELNPPLFFILEWIVARTVGASVDRRQ